MSGPMLFAHFDPSHTYLASVIQALDQHQVRVESVVLAQGLLNTLLMLGKGAKVSALEWVSTDRIALCQTNGTIVIYQPSSNSIVAELASGSSVAVSDFHFSPLTHTAWAADIGGALYEWDLRTNLLVQQFDFGTMLDLAEQIAKLASVMYNDEVHLLVGTHNVYLVDVFAKTIVKTFPAHVQPVIAMAVVPDQDDLFVSAAEGDRFANVYSISKGATKAVLAAQSPIQQLSLGQNPAAAVVAAVVEGGTVELFHDPFVFDAAPAESSRKKRKHLALAVQSKHCDATLRYARPAEEVRGPDDEHLAVGAVGAGDSVLHVCWPENGAAARFDAVVWYSGGFALSGDRTVFHSRVQATQAARAEKGHDVAAATHYSEAHTVITEGTAFQHDLEAEEDDESLADKLAKLNGGRASKQAEGRKKLNRHTAGTLTVVLAQALRNNDHSLLETVLCNRDPSVIQKTINRLDASLAVVLLDRLAERITRQQLRFEQLNFWLKWIIIIHGGVLSSMPNMSNKLASLHAILTKKAHQLPRLLELQGRVNMLQQQNSLKKEILNGTMAQDDYDDAETDVEYVEELDDAEAAGLIDGDVSDVDIDMDAPDDYDELNSAADDDDDAILESDGLSDVETAVEKTDVFE